MVTYRRNIASDNRLSSLFQPPAGKTPDSSSTSRVPESRPYSKAAGFTTPVAYILSLRLVYLSPREREDGDEGGEKEKHGGNSITCLVWGNCR